MAILERNAIPKFEQYRILLVFPRKMQTDSAFDQCSVSHSVQPPIKKNGFALQSYFQADTPPGGKTNQGGGKRLCNGVVEMLSFSEGGFDQLVSWGENSNSFLRRRTNVT